MSKEFDESLKEVITRMGNAFDQETTDKPKQDLEDYWFFKWRDSLSIEKNIYEFHKALNLYQNRCRKWEEAHNGSCCVVERVRDDYLIPKIQDFTKTMREKLKETNDC